MSYYDPLADPNQPMDNASIHARINRAGSYENGVQRAPGWDAARKYGPTILFVGGALSLRTKWAQLCFSLVLPFFIAGCYFLRHGGRTPASESSWWIYGEYHQTPASYFFFGLALLFAYLMNREQRRVNRVLRAQAQHDAQMAADAAWLAQVPRTLVPATVKPHNTVARSDRRTAPPTPTPAATSKLWLPSKPERRVRRGGETLGGTPIKDRRSVNPETIHDI